MIVNFLRFLCLEFELPVGNCLARFSFGLFVRMPGHSLLANRNDRTPIRILLLLFGCPTYRIDEQGSPSFFTLRPNGELQKSHSPSTRPCM